MTPPTHTTPPVISVNIEPRTKDREPELREALKHLVRDDPNLSFGVDAESGEIVVHGASELHLDAAVEQLFSRGICVNVGQPKVAYREALVRPADIEYTHDKQSGGTGQFARVKLRLEPNEPGKGNEFETEISGGMLPKEYMDCIEKGVISVWENGVLIGFPIVDMKVTLYDCAFHEVEPSAIAFEIATRTGMMQGCGKGGIKVLEPIMDVEVVTPVDFLGGIIGDIKGRRGQIRAQEMRGNFTVIRANVPLAEMFGYVSQLRSLSGGQASHSMAFSHYEAVPQNKATDPGNFPPAIGMRA